MSTRRYKARDIMTTDVVCVGTGTHLRDLEKIFLEKGISGAPVLDESGQLVGVISQTDLIHYHLTRGDRPFPESDFYHVAELEKAFAGSGYQIEDYDLGFVGDVMTPVVHSVDPDTSVEDLARLMTLAQIHRVIITERAKVVGLVSAMDLLKVIADPPSERTAAGRQDRAAKV